MEWTTDSPTQTGLYWAWDGLNVLPIDVYKMDGGMICFELGDDYESVRDLKDYSHFMGPLAPPESPTAWYSSANVIYKSPGAFMYIDDSQR